SMSEKRLAGWLLSAATAVGPVVSCGVLQRLQPILVNNVSPFRTEAVMGPRAGGARNRMKRANNSTSPGIFVTLVAKLRSLSGRGLKRQFAAAAAVSSRSC